MTIYLTERDMAKACESMLITMRHGKGRDGLLLGVQPPLRTDHPFDYDYDKIKAAVLAGLKELTGETWELLVEPPAPF